jgi:acetylglutamate kinase
VAHGTDADTAYNINADTAAAELSAALGASKLILLTDVPGLLRDKNDPSTLIPEVKLSEIPALIRDGVVSKGMIPKVDCCVDALRRGVQSAVILDGRTPHSLLMEMLTDEGCGTQIVGG